LLIDHYSKCTKYQGVILLNDNSYRIDESYNHILIKAREKVIIAEKEYFNRVTIVGNDNLILITDLCVIRQLLVVGRTNNIINLRQDYVINIVGNDNSLLNLAKEEGLGVEIRANGVYNSIANEGDPIVASIAGGLNRYRGVKEDRVLFSEIVYGDSRYPKIKTKKFIIGKKHEPFVFHRQ